MKRFAVIGVNYQQIGKLDELARLSFQADDRREIKRRLEGQLEGILFLSTCNRHEIFYAVQDPRDQARVRQVFEDWFAEKGVSPGLYHKGAAALRYLMELSLGLHSLLFGETDILHQIKTLVIPEKKSAMAKKGIPVPAAGEEENELGSKPFRLVLKMALRETRRMRSELPQLPKPVSIIAWTSRKIKSHAWDQGRPLVVLGGGMIGRELVGFFRHYPVYWAVRNTSKARYHLLKHKWEGVKVIDLDEFTSGSFLEGERLPAAVVAATSAGKILMRPDHFRAWRKVCAPAGRELAGVTTGSSGAGVAVESEKDDVLMVDLSVPINLDPELSEEPGLCLLRYEEISEIVNRHKNERHQTMEAVSARVTEALIQIEARLITNESLDVVRDMQAETYHQSRGMLNDLLEGRLGHLSPRDKRAIYTWAIQFNKNLNRVQNSGLEKMIESYFHRNFAKDLPDGETGSASASPVAE